MGQLSTERGTYKTVTAIFWPCLEPVLMCKNLKSLKVVPLSPAAVWFMVEGLGIGVQVLVCGCMRAPYVWGVVIWL